VGAPAATADDACGEEGQPKCPLQGWMEQNMQAPFEKEDLKALGAALEKAAKMSPDPKWNEGATGWAKIANDAAAAAKAGDFKAVRESCKTCHKAWRKQYREQHRKKALPK
jgi:cytochrome c556